MLCGNPKNSLGVSGNFNKVKLLYTRLRKLSQLEYQITTRLHFHCTMYNATFVVVQYGMLSVHSAMF